MTLLRGLKVIELAEMIAGPYAGKLIADLGADVTKVEQPAGDPARRLAPFVEADEGSHLSSVFLQVNTSKKSVVLDVNTVPGQRIFLRMVERADLLIEDQPPGRLDELGLSDERLRERNTRLVHLSVTPFGQTGPYRDFKAYPLNTFHSSGEGHLTPVGSRLLPNVLDRPPTRQGRFGSEYKLATYAATFALAEVLGARLSGVGSHIDLSKQEALIGLHHLELNKWLALGFLADRANISVALGGIVPCLDGYLEFSFYEEHQWRGLVTLLGQPEWADEEWARTPASRVAHSDDIYQILVEWLRERRKDDVVAAGQRVGCTVAPYNDVAELVSSSQLEARHYFQEVLGPNGLVGRYPTHAHKFSQEVCLRAAPALGQHNREVLVEDLGLSESEIADLKYSPSC